MPADIIATAIIDTPIGPLSLLAHGEALVGGGFTGDPGELHARLHPLPAVAAAGSRRAAVAGQAGPRLLRRRPDRVRRPARVPPGHGVAGAAVGALRAVPAGTTITYTGLAARAGHPARGAGGRRRVRRQPDRPGQSRATASCAPTAASAATTTASSASNGSCGTRAPRPAGSSVRAVAGDGVLDGRAQPGGGAGVHGGRRAPGGPPPAVTPDAPARVVIRDRLRVFIRVVTAVDGHGWNMSGCCLLACAEATAHRRPPARQLLQIAQRGS